MLLLTTVVVLGPGIATVGSATAAVGAQQTAQPGENTQQTQAEDDDAVNLTEVTVSPLAALQRTENETNGTALELRLTTQQQVPVYDILVLQDNGTLTEVVVDAK